MPPQLLPMAPVPRKFCSPGSPSSMVSRLMSGSRLKDDWELGNGALNCRRNKPPLPPENGGIGPADQGGGDADDVLLPPSANTGSSGRLPGPVAARAAGERPLPCTSSLGPPFMAPEKLRSSSRNWRLLAVTEGDELAVEAAVKWWCGGVAGGGLLLAAAVDGPESQARLPNSKGSPPGGTGEGVFPAAGAPDSRSKNRGGGPI